MWPYRIVPKMNKIFKVILLNKTGDLKYNKETENLVLWNKIRYMIDT